MAQDQVGLSARRVDRAERDWAARRPIGRVSATMCDQAPETT